MQRAGFDPLCARKNQDTQRHILVYVAYSNRVIEGSPKNSISSVPIMNWPGTQTSALPREQ